MKPIPKEQQMLGIIWTVPSMRDLIQWLAEQQPDSDGDIEWYARSLLDEIFTDPETGRSGYQRGNRYCAKIEMQVGRAVKKGEHMDWWQRLNKDGEPVVGNEHCKFVRLSPNFRKVLVGLRGRI